MKAKKAKAAPAKRKRASSKKPSVEYHVVPEDGGRRWNVERDDTFTGSFAYEVNTAIGLAIASAQREHYSGMEASVCVQHSDGSCRHVWP